MLSPQETAVVRGCALGKPAKVVAFELGISVGTVRTYHVRAKAKLGAPNDNAAVAVALALGLIDAREVLRAFGHVEALVA